MARSNKREQALSIAAVVEGPTEKILVEVLANIKESIKGLRIELLGGGISFKKITKTLSDIDFKEYEYILIIIDDDCKKPKKHQNIFQDIENLQFTHITTFSNSHNQYYTNADPCTEKWFLVLCGDNNSYTECKKTKQALQKIHHHYRKQRDGVIKTIIETAIANNTLNNVPELDIIYNSIL